ncbi:hypothetical protein QBC38DRAFT_461627 [Podospora fimiseda]|uniref:Uncharacterized protein n=1 Tax=Podospora fimiseda TaxID=252190 RepID=A0AAN6YRV6_9PEZI|nr:hypothetical protein QBC38DRAFT_461627 [Podospora fimiseda]
MQFFYLLPLLATLASAAPAEPATEAAISAAVDPATIGLAACAPASCYSFGCCSGNCGYWCRACKIPYTC